MMRLSVIIPTLNEAAGIATTLRHLQECRRLGHEVIVADGGSSDATRQLAQPLADRVLIAPRGRASQMNEGARHATGTVLLFLHADTSLPPDFPVLVQQALCRRCWGRFDIRLSGSAPLLRLVEWSINWRSRLSGVATGDQAIFLWREVFEQVGGFETIPLMEDVALSKRLRKLVWPCCLSRRAVTSSRRWEEGGILRTILLMWKLRLAYFLGADPRHLVRSYQAKVEEQGQ